LRLRLLLLRLAAAANRCLLGRYRCHDSLLPWVGVAAAVELLRLRLLLLLVGAGGCRSCCTRLPC
jgi:hypothetical protein